MLLKTFGRNDVSRAALGLTVVFSAFLWASVPKATAAAFIWSNTTGNWSDATKWVGSTAPSGTDATDTLTFGGDVGSVAIPTAYTSTNDVGGGAFLLDQITLAATGAAPDKPAHVIAPAAANALLFAGPTRQIVQNGSGAITFTTPLQATDTLTFAGSGAGQVTFNAGLSGAFDIVKNGTSTFRFGSSASLVPSPNTWIGRLTINNGIMRFNNNADTGPTALRSNPVTLNAATAQVILRLGDTDVGSLRLGGLSGAAGLVEARQVDANIPSDFDSVDIVLTVLEDSTYGGIVRNSPTGGGNNNGDLIVRGTATQTFTGAVDIASDVFVGRGATVTLAGNSSLAALSAGSVTLNGGTFKLDNTAINNGNRLRDASGTSTGLDTVGGGTFTFSGNAAGSSETVGRLQLGSFSTGTGLSGLRAGGVTVKIVHTAGSAAATDLTFQSYSRDSTTVAQNTTIDFTAVDATGAVLPLGQPGNNPHVKFGAAFFLPLVNGLPGSTGGASNAGWATVNGTDFATYDGSTGIKPVVTTPFPAGAGDAAANAVLTDSADIAPATIYNLNSLKLAPAGPDRILTIGSDSTFTTRGIVLGGSENFTITGASGGTAVGSILTSNTPRYFHVQQATLFIDAPIDPGLSGNTGAIVKAGEGTLALSNVLNASSGTKTVINGGLVRASTSSLPGGELRFRGGVLELSGGGTFTRGLGPAAGQVNWSGFDPAANGGLGAPIADDRGSGGFAAIGGNATVTIGGATPATLSWEDPKFVRSGHALIFGSRSADSLVNWTNNLSLSTNPVDVNYNAREIRVNDNAASAGDIARISGAISGTVYNDLLKTGAGSLELSNASNTYTGATVVREGTLLVNGSIGNSILTDVRPGGTLSGRGTVGATRVASLGIVSPGNLLGNTSVLTSGNIRFDANAKLTIQIGGIGRGGDGTNGYDGLNVVGGIRLDGAELEGSLLNGFTPQIGDKFFIMVNNGADAVNGTFANATSTVTFDGATFEVNYADNDPINGDGGFNDISLTAVVPEPSASVLLLVAGALLARRARSPRPTGGATR